MHVNKIKEKSIKGNKDGLAIQEFHVNIQVLVFTVLAFFGEASIKMCIFKIFILRAVEKWPYFKS